MVERHEPATQFDQATIYLAEEGIADIDDLIRVPAGDGPGYRRVPLRSDLGLDGAVFVPAYGTSDPGWKQTLGALIDDSLDEVATRQAGAVLIVRLADRIFAFAFGQGRHLLDRDRLVDDFGVRVAANTVDPQRIRSVDGRTFERGVILTRRQASRPGRVEALGLQVDREMFRAITGRSQRAGEGRIHGSTSLGLTRAIPFDELETLGVELLAAFAADTYRASFPTLDRLRPLARTDPMVSRLGERLLRDLRSPEPTAYLAPPMVLDWEGVSGFRFSTLRAVDFDEPELATYLVSLPGKVALDDLIKDEIRVVDRDSPRITSHAPVMRWLVWEVAMDSQAFVLADGRWYRADTDWVESVDNVIARIAPPSIVMPRPSRSMDEGAYNREAAAALGGVLLDRQLARVGTERGGFELCDIFIPPNHLVHVKRGLGSESLTYLFSQGVQAAEGLRRDRSVRERLAQLVGASDPLAAAALPVVRRPQPGELNVEYAVVTRNPQRVPRTLPFFARAALARAVRTLEDYDFGVFAAGVTGN